MRMECSLLGKGTTQCHRAFIVSMGIATGVVLTALYLLNHNIAGYIERAERSEAPLGPPTATVPAAHRALTPEAAASTPVAPAPLNPRATTGWQETFALAPSALVFTATATRGAAQSAADRCEAAEAKLRTLKEQFRSGYKLRDAEKLRERETELQRQRWTHCR
ncbi:MAG: hypothetical protein ACFCUG_15215 [Thiotrichales bacterium]